MSLVRHIERSEITQQQPLLNISTKNRESLPKAGTIYGEMETKTFLNAAHTFDLNSAGPDNKVFRFRTISDPQGPNPGEELGIRASQLFVFQPLEGSENNPAILGVGNNSKLTLSLYDSLSKKYKQRVFEPWNASQKIKQFYAERGPTGKIGVNAILEDDSLVRNSFSPSELRWDSDHWKPIQDPQGKPAKAREIAVCANNPAQSPLFAIGMEGKYQDRLLFAEDTVAFTKIGDLGAPVIMGRWGKVNHISIAMDADKLINIFAVEKQTGSVWVKKQKKCAEGNRIEFDYWKAIAEATQFPVKMQRVYAMMQLNQQLEVFCVGEDEKLYHTPR